MLFAILFAVSLGTAAGIGPFCRAASPHVRELVLVGLMESLTYLARIVAHRVLAREPQSRTSTAGAARHSRGAARCAVSQSDVSMTSPASSETVNAVAMMTVSHVFSRHHDIASPR